MLVVARRELLACCDPSADRALLLEGSWPSDMQAGWRWALDDVFDARHETLDVVASELAEHMIAYAPMANESGPPAASHPAHTEWPTSLADLNALRLRYHLVKLLRVVAFFAQQVVLRPGEVLSLVAARDRDEEYAELLAAVAANRRARLTIDWHRADAPAVAPPPSSAPWRRWLARLNERTAPRAAADGSPRIVLAGNPAILDPVCSELVARGCRVWWLYDRFAVRSCLRWRPRGVGQLVCAHSNTDADRHPHAHLRDARVPALRWGGVNLAPALRHWLARCAEERGPDQARQLAAIDAHWRRLRPTHLVLDEDATPLPRAALAVASRWGTPSTVVQHGAPCVRFGFAPLAADQICVWGEASRQQLTRWGVPPQRIVVTGSPRHDRRRTTDPTGRRQHAQPTASGSQRVPCANQPAQPTVLVLDTVPPRDERPDALGFHLTTATYRQMIHVALEAIARRGRARVLVRPHPRTTGSSPWPLAAARWPGLEVVVDRRGDLFAHAAAARCVVSCASSAGIEATLAGAAVVQLLPVGSGDVLPAEGFGLLGSARTVDELDALLERVWNQPAAAMARGAAVSALAAFAGGAARRVVDAVLAFEAPRATTTRLDAAHRAPRPSRSSGASSGSDAHGKPARGAKRP